MIPSGISCGLLSYPYPCLFSSTSLDPKQLQNHFKFFGNAYHVVKLRPSRLQRAEELQQRDDDMVEASKGLDIHMRVKHDIHGIFSVYHKDM